MSPTEPPRGLSTGLAGAPPPTDEALAQPAVLESYVRAALHRDRQPGVLVAVVHPLRTTKVPRGLLEAVAQAGWEVRKVETAPDRVASITGIRDALLDAAQTGKPIDVVVFSGDGSLDHHLLVAAFWAFYPDLVQSRPGELRLTEPTPDEWSAVPAAYRRWLDPLPPTEHLEPTEKTLHQLWVLRARLAPLLARGRAPDRLLREGGAEAVRLAAFGALFPHRAIWRAHGFDLRGLVEAPRERLFVGLTPFLRSISAYPAGTAADNALYAGVPGWSYAQAAGWLARLPWLEGVRQRWEAQAIRAFLDFLREGVVVPARFSVVSLDGAWQAISSHAVGGPGGGSFFAPDLEKKTGGLLGYLARIPSMILFEGLLGSTVLRVRASDVTGQTKVAVEGRMVEGLYTNRAFIAGVGSVPSTNPTSFAGQSSLVLGPPLLYRDLAGRLTWDSTGLLSFTEAIVKGILGRALHLVGIGAGRLAGGGRFALATPEHQITLTEGERVEMTFLAPDRSPRFAPVQASGDPFQAHTLALQVAWGPLPLLAAPDSLLLAAAQRALTRLRDLQTWNLKTVYIGGVPFFQHEVGQSDPAQTGLLDPPRTLPWRLDRAQLRLTAAWEALGTGRFVDTTEQGMALGRHGRHAHTSDQTAHLVLVRDGSTLLVRQVRRREQQITEARSLFRAGWGGWVLHDHQVRAWLQPDLPPTLLSEAYYFQDAANFRLEAPRFFPFLASDPATRTWPRVLGPTPPEGSG